MIVPLSDHRVEVLLRYVNQCTKGASLKEIEAYLTPPVPRRTLQSWVAELVRFGRLRARGAARSRRYFVPDAAREFVLRVPPGSVGSAGTPLPAMAGDGIAAANGVASPTVESHAASANGVPSAASAKEAVAGSTKPSSAPQRPAAVQPVIDPRFAALLRQLVPSVVTGLRDKASAREMLLQGSMVALQMDRGTIDTFVSLAMKALERLTPENIVDYGIRPKEYELWKKYWR